MCVKLFILLLRCWLSGDYVWHVCMCTQVRNHNICDDAHVDACVYILVYLDSEYVAIFTQLLLLQCLRSFDVSSNPLSAFPECIWYDIHILSWKKYVYGT